MKFRVPRSQQLADGRVGTQSNQHPHHHLLASGTYGVILIEKGKTRRKVPHLYVGEGTLPQINSHNLWLTVLVLALYAKGGGKAGAHAWQSNSNSIGAISYLAMQVYEFTNGHFRAVHVRNRALQVCSFALVPSDMFLITIPPACVARSSDRRTLILDGEGSSIFSQLSNEVARVGQAAKALKAGRKSAKKSPDEEEGL